MTAGADSSETLELPTADLMPVDLPVWLAIAIVDDAGRIHRWSRGCETLYGWSAADAIGAVKYDLLRSALSDHTTPTSGAVGCRTQSLAETRRDGHVIRVVEQTIPLTMAGYRALCMMHDPVTDNHWADDSRRIAIAQEMNAIGIFGYNIPARKLDWSQHCWQPLGLEGGSVSLDKLIDGTFGSAVAAIVTAYRDVVRGGGGDQVDMELPVTGGRLGNRTLRLRGNLMRDEHGIVDRIVGVMQDLTVADIREQALRDREAELSAILDTASDAMVVVDGVGTISAFSRAAQHLLGYDGLAVIGRPIDRLVEGDWPEIVEATADGSPCELRMIVANGDRLPVQLRIGSLPGDGASGHILFLTDISERKAQERRRSLFERTARDIAMAEFAAHLMHELNQPLAAASNFLAVAQQLATRPPASINSGEMIERALDQIQRVGGIIRGMHQKAAGEDMDPQTILVRAAIEEAVTLVSIARSDGCVAVSIDVHPEAETMFVDPVGIQQVLANLLRNAMEAFGPVPHAEAQIEIKSRRTNRGLVLSVGDNGPGIAAAMTPDLFEPFGQRDKEGGMGLGLSICRTIVEAHGGTLMAENLSTGGACFSLILPPDQRDDIV